MNKDMIVGYVLGLIDAEASFSVSIKMQKDLAKKEPLELVSRVIGAGRILRKPGQRHLYLLVIDNMGELTEKLIPFLDTYLELLSAKREQYSVFRDIVLSLHRGHHRNYVKLKELVSKAYKLSVLSSKARRRRNIEEIFTLMDLHIARRRDLPGER